MNNLKAWWILEFKGNIQYTLVAYMRKQRRLYTKQFWELVDFSSKGTKAKTH